MLEYVLIEETVLATFQTKINEKSDIGFSIFTQPTILFDSLDNKTYFCMMSKAESV